MKIGEVILNRGYCKTRTIGTYEHQMDELENGESIALCPHEFDYRGNGFSECGLSCIECCNTNSRRWVIRSEVLEDDD